MTAIFFDTEYTAWEGSWQRDWALEWEHREVIQLGAVACGISGGVWTVSREFECLVKPVRNPVLSEYIIRLTGISQAELDRSGFSFPDALTRFLQFIESPADVILSWGNDGRILQENADLHGVPFDFEALPFRDVRPAFAMLGLPVEDLESGRLCNFLGIDPGRGNEAHHALSDARGIMNALRHLAAGQNRSFGELGLN